MPKAGVTVRHSKERIELLAKASSHGEKFFATGGEHVTSDDAFKAAEIVYRTKRVKDLEKEKKERIADEETEKAALNILELEKPVAKLVGTQLKVLLLFYGHEKKEINTMNVSALKKALIVRREKDTAPKEYKKWTETDEDELNRLKVTDNMDVMDTAVGRHKQTLVIESKQMYASMSQEEKDKFNRDLEVIDRATVDDRASV